MQPAATRAGSAVMPWSQNPPRGIDFDEASKLWRANKHMTAPSSGFRYYRAPGDRVYCQCGVRWREAVVTAVYTSSVDVELADFPGRVLKGLADGPTQIRCFSSTCFVARHDGDGYDLRPTRRQESRKVLGSKEASVFDLLRLSPFG